MGTPNLLMLSKLLSQAPAGDPLAKAALPAARDEFITPPPISGLQGSKLEFEPSGPASGVSFDAPSIEPSGSMPPEGQNTQMSGGNSEDRGSFWNNDKAIDTLKLGLGGLLGAGIGKLTGLGGGNVAAGALNAGLRDIQTKQAVQMKREQAAWEDAYNQAKSLPADVYTNPELQELLQAQQALMKDLADGKVNNPRSVSDFLVAKAKYSKDLDAIALEKKITEEKTVRDRLAEAELMRSEQQAIRYREMLQPGSMASPAEIEEANAFLAEHDKAKREFEYRKQQDMEENKDRDEQLQLQQRRLGIDARQVSAQEAYNKERLASAERIARTRAGLANMAGLQRQIQQDINNRIQAEKANMGQVDIAKIEAEVYAQRAGIRMLSPGNAEIFGKPVQLDRILGNDPAMWDAGGTPSAAGWAKVIGVAKQAIDQGSQQLLLSNLQGTYQE